MAPTQRMIAETNVTTLADCPHGPDSVLIGKDNAPIVNWLTGGIPQLADCQNRGGSQKSMGATFPDRPA